MTPGSAGAAADRNEYTFQYSLDDDDQPTLAIVNAVAWVAGVDASELKPLGRVIQLDALRELLRYSSQDFYRSSAQEPPELEVSFRYEDREVTVTRSQISVRDR